MKNKFIYIARMAALPLLLAATACEDTLIAPAPGIAGDGPTLTLTLDNNEEKAGTRSELTSPAPTNHVTTVRILVFQQMTDGAEPVYVGQEPQDIDWLNYGGETVAVGQRSRITYQLNYPFERGATYTLLGVAMDENFDDDYTLEVEGKTLSNAVAILKDGKTGTDIAKHEFFTGTTTFTHEGRDTHIDDLLMKRRVAGILLYVTDVPQTMPSHTNNTTNCRTTAIRLRLGEKDNVTLQQNKSVTLYRDLEDEDWTEPGTPTQQPLEGSNVLTTIDISSWTYTPNKECYMETIDGVEQIKKSAPTGLYILPLTTDDSTPTLQVDIVGKADSDGDGTPDKGAQEEVLKTLTVQNMSETGQPTAFSLRSNYIYSIGKYNPDQGIDQPISLLGEAIYLEVLPFEKVPATEHEFGEARVHALFNEEDTIYDCINQEFTVKVLPPLTTVRSSVKKITLTPLDNTYVMNKEGDFVTVEKDEELSTTDQQNYYNNWLYVKSNNGEYMNAGEIDLTDKLTDNEGCQLNFFIYDYARPRKDWGWKVENLASDEYSWQGDNNEIERINNDIRYKELVLATTIQWNNEEITKYDTLRVRQYNTITVYYNPKTGDKDAPTYCGFRRYDVYRDDAKPGDAEPQASYAWKFTIKNTVNATIYTRPTEYLATGSLYNGSINLSILGNGGYLYWENDWIEGPNGCAMKYGQSLFRVIEAGNITSYTTGNNERNNGECWYLPAQYEMEGLMIMASYNKSYTPIVTNIHPAKSTDQVMFWYWTSTLPDASFQERDGRAIAYHYIKEDEKEHYQSTYYDRDKTAFIRQARRFPEEYNYAY